MWNPFDQLAKCLLSRAIEPLGTTQTETEVHPSTQRIDLWFEPAPARDDIRARLGLLGRICATPCMLEPFHTTPSQLAVRDCVRKLHNFDHWRAQEAKRARRPRPPMPRLWILSPGRPQAAIDRYQMQPMHDWPTGFLHSIDGLALHLAILRELPPTRDSLLLRLLGVGPTFAQAIEDLHALPDDAWERTVAIPLLLAFHPVLPPRLRQISSDEVTMHPYTEKLLSDYAAWEQRTLAQGHQRGLEQGLEKGLEQGLEKGLEQGLEKGLEQGLEKGLEQGLEKGLEQGLRRALMAVYQARFGTTPADLPEALARVRDGDALERLAAVFAARSQEDIATAVHAAAAAR